MIRIAPGTYREKVHIRNRTSFSLAQGSGREDVVLSWDDAAISSGGTSKSGSVTVDADGFEAENLTIENTWENEHARTQEGSQAVALLMSSDRAVLDRVRLLGAQDTLYANSRTCHENLPEGWECAACRYPCLPARHGNTFAIATSKVMSISSLAMRRQSLIIANCTRAILYRDAYGAKQTFSR